MAITRFTTHIQYINAQPAKARAGLRELRAIIKKAAPEAEELISYHMPGFKQNGMLVWYAAASTHFGFYPTANGIKQFKDKLTSYETSKGTIRFPFDKPLPKKLITDIVKFRLAENNARAAAKSKVKAKPAKKKSTSKLKQ